MAKKPRTRAPKIDKWEVENAADTLMRANEIKQNKVMMRRAKAVLTKRQKAISKVIKAQR